MQVASINTNNRRKTTILLTVAVLLTGVLVALLVMILNKINTRQVVQKKAQTLTTGPSCPANSATCSWSFTGSGDVTFDYVIKDITDGDTPYSPVVKKGQTPNTSVNFTPTANHTYKCTAFAINNCGTGPAASAQNTCLTGPSPTPTPTIPGKTPTPTPTLPPGVTPSPTSTPSKTPTPTPTLPPGVTPTITPIPTSPPGATPTITPTPTEIIIVVQSTTPQPTTVKTSTTTQPPQAGSLLPSLLIAGFSLAIIIFGLVL